MSLPENIKRLRKQKGWSQAVLAEKVGSHMPHVNRLETGKYNPSLKMLLKLAEVFEVSLDCLVSDKEGDFENIKIENKALIEKIRLIEALDADDRKALMRVIDCVLTKQKISNLISQQAEELESVGK